MREQYKKISDRWNRCERLLKTAEKVRSEVVISAINELRYAGRRIADALVLMHDENSTQEDARRAEDFLNEAFHFCERAEHDCVDAITSYVHVLIKKYDEKYDRDMINAICPELKSYRTTLKPQVDELIQLSREQRDKRDTIYQQIIETHLQKFIQISIELQDARDHLDSEHTRRLKQYDKREMEFKREKFISRLSLGVGVAFGLVGLIGTVFSIVTYSIK